MAETFDFPFELGAGGDETPRMRQVSFGDGYQQSIEDGINTLQVSWGITISGDHARIIAARDFLRRHAGVRWFWWRPPLEPGLIKVKCKSWRPVHTSTTSASLALTLAGLVMGGIVGMMTPVPTVDAGSADSGNSKSSYLFGGTQNTGAQGMPVPVGSGVRRYSGIVVSAGIDVEDM